MKKIKLITLALALVVSNLKAQNPIEKTIDEVTVSIGCPRSDGRVVGYVALVSAQNEESGIHRSCCFSVLFSFSSSLDVCQVTIDIVCERWKKNI